MPSFANCITMLYICFSFIIFLFLFISSVFALDAFNLLKLCEQMIYKKQKQMTILFQQPSVSFISYGYTCYYTYYTVIITIRITFPCPQGVPGSPAPVSWQAYPQTFHTVHRKTAPVPTARYYSYIQYRLLRTVPASHPQSLHSVP